MQQRREAQTVTAVDVLVIGGGMAGAMAAMAAAGDGRRVVIVEPSNVLGGQGTAGGVAGFCGDTAKHNDLFAELVARLTAHELIAEYNPRADRRPYDLEWCAFFLQEMLIERGVEPWLHARVIDAQRAGDRITSVTISTAGDVMAVQAAFVIDATGRCVVPTLAGLDTTHDGVNRQLPMSLYFTLWNSGAKVTPILPPGCPTWQGDDDLPMTTLHGFKTGKVEVKMKVVGFDAADGISLSQAEVFARRQMMGLIYHLQTQGYRGTKLDTYVLASVSRHIGIREQRRLIGEHVLTEDEVTHACVFDDAVAVGTYHLDYHWPDKMQRAGTGITTMVEPYHIPLRCMQPRGVSNLLVPGRGASGDQMALSSYRVMATVAQMGFAAGLAARQCVAQQRDLSHIDVAALRQDIEAGGQSLDLSDHGQYLSQHSLQHEYVFEDDRPFAQCHASTIVQCRNGRMLVAWFGGTKEQHSDVGIWLSARFEARWSPPRCVAKVNEQPHWNPVLFRDASGVVHLYFKVGPTARRWRTWVMRSEDEGATWSEPVELVPGDDRPRGPVKNKPITLADGTWLAPSSIETDTPDAAAGEGAWDVFVDRSDDGGRTWRAGAYVPLDRTRFQGLGVIQPTLWESQPGCVHMLMRSTSGRICRSDSADGGRTWSTVYATDLPNNNSGLDLAKLDDGALALVHNPVEANWGARTPLTIALSHDNGMTWPERLDIETGDGEFSYPAIIATRKGMAITYTWKRQRIAYWHGSVEHVRTAR